MTTWLPDDWTQTPNYWPIRRTPTTVGLHTTRGGKHDLLHRRTRHGLQVEYNATRSWFSQRASQASGHVLVGPMGRLCRFCIGPVPLMLDAAAIHEAEAMPRWHAGIGQHGVALTSLAIELVQEWPDDAFDGLVLERGAEVCAVWARDYAIPVRWIAEPGVSFDGTTSTQPGFWLHEQIVNKTDPGPMFPAREWLSTVAGLAVPSFPGAETLPGLRARLAHLEEQVGGLGEQFIRHAAKVHH